MSLLLLQVSFGAHKPRGDLINTLDALLEKKRLDYVLVELNGLADPSQIIHTFWVDDGQGSLIELHQVVALVDAKSFAKKLESTTILSQADSGALTDKEDSKFPENELLLR